MHSIHTVLSWPNRHALQAAHLVLLLLLLQSHLLLGLIRLLHSCELCGAETLHLTVGAHHEHVTKAGGAGPHLIQVKGLGTGVTMITYGHTHTHTHTHSTICSFAQVMRAVDTTARTGHACGVRMCVCVCVCANTQACMSCAL